MSNEISIHKPTGKIAARRALRAQARSLATKELPAADTTKPYVSPIPMETYNELVRQSNNSIDHGGATGLLGGVVYAVPTFIATNLAFPGFGGSFPQSILVIGGFGLVSFSSLGHGIRVEITRQRILKQVQAKLMLHFTAWSKARYGVLPWLTGENDTDFIHAIASGDTDLTQLHFTNINKKAYDVLPVRGGYTVAEVKPRIETEQVATIAAEVALDLPGEARVLHAHITELLTLLDTQSLTPEAEHLIGRARTDIAETLTAWQNITVLGSPTAEDEQRLTKTLTVLNDEVVQVLEQMQADARRNLAVQERYVTNRDSRDAFATEILNLEQGAAIKVIPTDTAEKA